MNRRLPNLLTGTQSSQGGFLTAQRMSWKFEAHKTQNDVETSSKRCLMAYVLNERLGHCAPNAKQQHQTCNLNNCPPATSHSTVLPTFRRFEAHLEVTQMQILLKHNGLTKRALAMTKCVRTEILICNSKA